MISHPTASWIVARKELAEHFRSKRILIIGIIFATTFGLSIWATAAFSEDFFGSNDPGERILSSFAFYFGSGFLFFFGGYVFASVLAIVLSADAVVGEWKDRTLFLLFSRPVKRWAVLAGKIVGAYLSVLTVIVAVFGAGLLVMLLLFGLPSAESFGRLMGGLALMIFGLLPFVSLGILCSTWLRTPATSFVVALGLWLILLPIVGRLGEIILFIRRDFDLFEDPPGYVEFFHYFDPMNLLQSVTGIWLRDSDILGFLQGFQGAPSDIPLVILAMSIHIAIYLSVSFLILARRDYA